MTKRVYGWIPDHPDQRDVLLRMPMGELKELPPIIDMRSEMPPIFNQGELGSCTANATGAQTWHLELKAGHPSIEPSRLFTYYNSRVLQGTIKHDSGASIRNSIKSTVRWGVAPETDWVYDISKFTKKPPEKAYKSAAKELIVKYANVTQSSSQLRGVLASGFTVNFGFSVYDSFESAEVAGSGIVPMPTKNERLLGGHAVLIVGYDDTRKVYIVRNSWGTTWGDHGYFYMPYAYVHNTRLASDFWTIKAVP